ncbi:MAG TPA: DUF6600 domain-containing protein [Casimicrobiaceae bacterium]|nr:DUF6600 domain-containing protein [Casimicrobiaceae bacterium]
MMTRSKIQWGTWLTACGVVAWLGCGAALADPPGRVARLAQISGAVSFSPAGEEDWVVAQPNRPLITGDRVWADSGSRAELEIGTASARLGSTTSVTLLNLDDRIAQIDLAQGTLNLRVRRVYPEQVFEIDTPNLAFSIRRAGDFRVDVDPAGNATVIRVRNGEGQAWGEGAAYTIGAGQQATFVGAGLQDYSFDPMSAPDEFDNWCLERDRRVNNAVAARYVSPDIVGYSDLDDYGAWRAVEGYGNVWFPTAVAADWVPYRTGHWAWVDPWGWTWVDDAPWGFAPFHYGRWAYVSARWCWVPGPIAVRPIYAPALVAFVGGGGFSLALATGAVAGIAWFPLGPGEVYQPSYAVSRNYFTSVNVTNTVVNTTVINNVYNNNVTNIVYRNRELPGAVTAVPTTAFSSAEPVARHLVPVSPAVVAREPVGAVAAIAPSRASVLAAGAVAAGAAAAVAVARRPPAAVLARPVVAKTPPPPAPTSFAAKASMLAAQPGKPLEAEKLKSLQPARAAEAARIKVVAPTVAPQPLSKAGGGQGAHNERAAAPGPAAAGAATVSRPPERKGAPSAAVPQPPAPAQERALQEHKGPPQGAPVPQPPAPPQERALQEHKGPPQGAPVPQPPAPPQGRALQERKGPPQAAPVPQPPQRAQEERRGPPSGAAVTQPAPSVPERKQESRVPPPSTQASQPPKQQATKVTPATPQERAVNENRGAPPPAAKPPPPKTPPPPPPQPAAKQEQKAKPKPEENKAKEKEQP